MKKLYTNFQKNESQKSGIVCNVCKSCKTNYSNKYKKNPSQYTIEKEFDPEF
jgi:hypothetical protein